MACDQAKSNIKNNPRQPPVSKDQGKRPQGIKKQESVRKSTRLQAIENLRKQSTSKSHYIQEVQALLSPPTSNSPEGRKVPQDSRVLHEPFTSSRKRNRGQEEQEAELLSSRIREQPPSKRPQISSPSCTAEERAASDVSKNSIEPIQYWVCTGRWQKKYFEQDSQVREELEQDSWLEEKMENSTQVIQYVEIDGNRYPRPIRRAPTSVRRKQSDSSLNDSSDQKKRESKSAPYRDIRYTTLLKGKGSFMDISDLGITDASKTLCRSLLESEQIVPKDSLFRDNLFEKTCRKIQDRNEARVIQDISRLIIPSAETLATYGAVQLEHLIEGVDECWTGNIAVVGPLPKPDYSVGFTRSAFTNEQLKKLDPLIGSVFENSFFVATYRMYFPFLTGEVKCGAAALDVADRQNAHSMTLAVRGVVALYKAVKREKELHREILAFSISHDHRAVRIYGHYPIINGNETTFYRHPIRDFSFTELDGKEKWAAYKFTKNVYDTWMPKHLERICSAINEIPAGINFEISQSELQFPDEADLQLSLELDVHLSQQSNTGSVSALEEDDSFVGSQGTTANTSFTQIHRSEFKKPRKKRAAS